MPEEIFFFPIKHFFPSSFAKLTFTPFYFSPVFQPLQAARTAALKFIFPPGQRLWRFGWWLSPLVTAVPKEGKRRQLQIGEGFLM